MRGLGLVFDNARRKFGQRMIRIYRWFSVAPDQLGQKGVGNFFISEGLWSFSDDTRINVTQFANIDLKLLIAWLDNILGWLKGNEDMVCQPYFGSTIPQTRVACHGCL